MSLSHWHPRHWFIAASEAAGKSVYEKCLDAVHTTIVNLGLADIDPTSILLRKVSWTRGMAMPGIIVCPQDDPISAATNESDDVRYGVLVVMARVSNQDLSIGLNTVLLWRESISQAFRARDIVATVNIDEIYNVNVKSGAVFWEPGFVNQHDVGALTIECFSRESRA